MRQNKTKTEFYYRPPSVMLSDDRLDFSYWHPKYDNQITELSATEYEVVKLRTILKTPIISGTTPKDYVFPMKGIIFLGSRNIKNGKIDLTDLSYIEESIHNRENKSRKVNKGDVLVSMAGSVGRCAVYEFDFESNMSQSVARLQPDEHKINAQYLVYYLNSPFGQTQFERIKHDVDQPNINTTEMGEILIICPPNESAPNNIQERIVDEIKHLEDKVMNYERKKEKIWDDLLSVIIRNLGLKIPHSDNNYYIKLADSINDRLDFVWNNPLTNEIRDYLKTKNAVPLGELIQGDIEYGVNAYGTEKGEIAFINVENLNLDSKIHSENIRYIDKVPEQKLLKENDILISRSRTVGLCGVVTKKEKCYTFGSYILRFRIKPDKQIDPFYIANFINSKLGEIQIVFLQTGSRDTTSGGGNNINPEQLKQLMIALPDNSTPSTQITNQIRKLLLDKESMESQLFEARRSYENAFESIMNKSVHEK